MKKARENWLIKGSREKDEQEYHHKRKEAQKIIRNKKKTYMKNVTESIEEDQKHNNTRKMYETLNQIKKGYQHKFSIIRNKKGELTMNTKEKAKIWKEYFDKLLNTEEPGELIKKGNYQNGFRDGRSVIGNIFALKIINEKLWEYNQCTIFIYLFSKGIWLYT